MPSPCVRPPRPPELQVGAIGVTGLGWQPTPAVGAEMEKAYKIALAKL